MRIAFYAPLKQPDSPTPSGDRTIARNLLRALRHNGDEVRIACRLSSVLRIADRDRQNRQARIFGMLADRIERNWQRAAWRPELWLTYHLYDRAPDFLGPVLAQRLAIPYVVVEASLAPSRAHGGWRVGHLATEHALGQARRVIGINPTDRECVLPALAEPCRYHDMTLFTAAPRQHLAPGQRRALRHGLASRWRLAQDRTWLVCAAMMRPGVKVQSYLVLARAMSRLSRRAGRSVQWIIAGDGDGRDEVETMLRRASLGKTRLRMLGRCDERQLQCWYQASDLFVWPAIGEALCMSFLEAQSCGLPGLVGRRPGTLGIAAHGAARLVRPHDGLALASQIEKLVATVASLHRLRRQASCAARYFWLGSGARRLRRILHDAIEAGPCNRD